MKSAFRSPHIHKRWFHNDRSSWFHQWIVIGDDFMMKVGGEITSEFTSEIIKISVAFAIWFSYCDIRHLMILYDRQYMNHLWRIDPVITDSLSESAQARSLGRIKTTNYNINYSIGAGICPGSDRGISES